METYWVYKYRLAFVFYTSLFVKYGAMTIGPVILIKPKDRTAEVAEGLLRHELVHVKQFYDTWGLNGIRYLFSKNWRFKYELAAYREQLKYVPDAAEIFAWYLSTRYGLKVTIEEALALLRA